MDSQVYMMPKSNKTTTQLIQKIIVGVLHITRVADFSYCGFSNV